MKAFSFLLAIILCVTTAPAGSSSILALAGIFRQGTGDIPDFAFSPASLGDSPDPDVQATTRGGVWSDDSNETLGWFQMQDAVAQPGEPSPVPQLDASMPEEGRTGVTTGTTGVTGGTTGATTGTTGGTGATTGTGGGGAPPVGDPTAGPGFPWEGTAPGGGSPGIHSHVVTNTGNR